MELAILTALLTSMAASCDGSLGGTGGDGGGGGGDARLADANGDDGGSAGSDGGSTPFDAGPCAGSLASSLSIVTASDVHASGELFAAPTDGAATVLGWVDGSVHVRRIDPTGASAGPDITLSANELHGVAAAADAYAALVARDADVLALEVVGTDGSMIADHTILGGVDHDVTGNEWFGPLIRHGRLVWTGTAWAAYYPVQRLWPDGIQHYGDQLRTFARDGSPVDTLWDWGCSHSVDTRLASNASGLGPVCTSDCYPGKGVYFMHDTLLYDDPSGDCMGGVDTHLGGVAGVAGGFWVAFATPAGRSSRDVGLARVAGGRLDGAVTWLASSAAVEDDVHLAAAPDGGAVAAWSDGTSGHIVRVDPGGAAGTVEDIDNALVRGASDYFSWPSGDVGWALPGTSGARLVRLPASCL